MSPAPSDFRRLRHERTEVLTDRELAFPDATVLGERLYSEAALLGGTAWLIAWLDDAVLLGVATADRLEAHEKIEPAFLQELRLFAPAGEWHLWRIGQGFAARRRQDGRGDPIDVLEDDQSLWGMEAERAAGGWTTLVEHRGIRYALPAAVTGEDLPLRLRLHHYLGYDEAGIAGVVDSRLVAICTWAGRPLAPGGDGNV